MMKKGFMKKVVLTLLCICLLAMTGCGEETEKKPTNQDSVKQETDTVEEGFTVLCDFEKWEPDFSLIKLFNDFGKISRNTDSAYVKRGTMSAKLQPIGIPNSADKPMFYIPLNSALYDFNYGDVTNYYNFSVSVYNAEEYDVEIGVGLVYEESVPGRSISKMTEAQISVLKPGWNEVEYLLQKYPYTFTNPTISEYSETECKAVYFNFETVEVEGDSVEDAPVLYMDDFGYYALTDNQPKIVFEEKGVKLGSVGVAMEVPAFSFQKNEEVVEGDMEFVLTCDEDGSTVDIQDNKFVPDKAGTYTLTIKNTYNKVVTDYYYTFIVRDVPKEGEYESCDSKYSLFNISGSAPGMKIAYEEGFSATDDGSGSVKLINQHGWGWPGALVTSRQKLDKDKLSDYKYFTFKIYIPDENAKKYVERADGKKYKYIAILNQSIGMEVPIGEWYTVSVDAEQFWAQYKENEAMYLVWLDNAEESQYGGESYLVEYYIDEIMLRKAEVFYREYAENEIDNCTAANNFTGSPWSSVEYCISKSRIDDGSGSVQMNCWNGWPNANMTVSSKTYDEIMKYDYVSVWVYIDSTQGLVNGDKEVVFWNETQKMYLTPGKWHNIAITTNDFVKYAFDTEKNAKTFSLMMVQNCADDGRYDPNAKVYIDDIYLLKDSSAVKLSDFVPDYAGQGGSFIYDTTISHTNDGTGTVKMLSEGRHWPHAAVNLGMTKEELSQYGSLTYWIMMESPSGNKQIRAYICGLDYAENYNVGEWYKITVPTSKLKIDENGVVDLFNMLNDTPGVGDFQAVIYIDDITLTEGVGNNDGDTSDRSIGAIGLSDFVADYGYQGGSFTYDKTVSHTTDGTGAVKMSSDNRPWPHAAANFGMTAEELAEYASISFWIMMESPSGNEKVRMYVPSIEQADDYNVGEWYKITIPTSKVIMDANGVVDLFHMLNDTPGVGDYQAQIYIDDVVLETGTGSGDAPGGDTPGRVYAEDEVDNCTTVENFTGSAWSEVVYNANMSRNGESAGSIQMNCWNGWPIANMIVNGKTYDEILAYDYVSVWVYIDSTEGLVSGKKEVVFWNHLYKMYLEPGKWHNISITTTDFVKYAYDSAKNPQVFNLIMVQNCLDDGRYDANAKVYIDDVYLINDVASVKLSDFVPDYSGQGGSFSYDVNASHTEDGTGSVKMSCDGRIWPHAAVKLGVTKEELSKYETLSFWIMMESPSGNAQVRMHIPAIEQTNDYNVREWYQITIPASKIIMDANGVTDLFFMLNDTAVVGDPNAIIYIDEITLTKLEMEIPLTASSFVSDYASQGGSFSECMTISHLEDASGSVKMSCDGRIWPHAAVNLGVTVEELSKYKTLSFWIMMESLSGNEKVRMHVPAIEQTNDYTVGEWYQITIPTNKVTMDANGVTDLFFMLNDTAVVGDPQAYIYIDDMVLTKAN